MCCVCRGHSGAFPSNHHCSIATLSIMMSAVMEGWSDKHAGLPGKLVYVSSGGRHLDSTNKTHFSTMHCTAEDHFQSEKNNNNAKEEVDCFPICLSLQKSKNTTEDELPQPQDCWLMRLFESTLFDMSIAIGYLFNSKEPGVQRYLGNRLFVSVTMLVIVWVCLPALAVGVLI